jgi:hypothetical protein
MATRDPDEPSSFTGKPSQENDGRSPMRVFLIQTAKGLFSSSGGYKANICLLRFLASRGHSVRQLCYSYHDEVETYLQKTGMYGRSEMGWRTRLLRLRGDSGRPAVLAKINELMMDDGVEIVALESEAMDEAFGGKEKLKTEMAREAAEYIEVSGCHVLPL